MTYHKDLIARTRQAVEADNKKYGYISTFNMPKADATILCDALEALTANLGEMRQRKDSAYEERNKVVSALAKLFPSGIAKTAIEGWSEDWHGCVYIDLPTGQVSWHFREAQAHLFAGLPNYHKKWDGHDTPTKYRRLEALTAAPTGWMPIETAPKDGTEILVWNAVPVGDASGSVMCVYWNCVDRDWEWCVVYSQDYLGGYATASNPTHWMPLPPAPGAATWRPSSVKK